VNADEIANAMDGPTFMNAAERTDAACDPYPSS